MKNLLSAIACCLALACYGQGTTIHEYPWNPDWNNDNFVGSSDLTGFLSAFGSEFGNSPEPCDYDGTEIEEFFAGLLTGDIIMDSLFVEYQLEDVSTYFLPGCPEAVTDTVILSDSFMLRYYQLHPYYWRIYDSGVWREFKLSPDYESGNYTFRFKNESIAEFIADGFFQDSYSYTASAIPWPDTWILDEDGLHFTWSNGWCSYANYMHILPYWHYAE